MSLLCSLLQMPQCWGNLKEKFVLASSSRPRSPGPAPGDALLVGRVPEQCCKLGAPGRPSQTGYKGTPGPEMTIDPLTKWMSSSVNQVDGLSHSSEETPSHVLKCHLFSSPNGSSTSTWKEQTMFQPLAREQQGFLEATPQVW